MKRIALGIFVLGLMTTGGLPARAAEADVLPRAEQRLGGVEGREVPDFQRHVLPLMGKLGCNGRACHGSFQGQGGFRLSLFGYDFKADHESLLNGEKPRVDREDPEGSLMLEKPTLGIPHKGGKRMDVDGWEYRMFVRWIKAGAKGTAEDAIRFDRLEVQPSHIVFKEKGGKASLRVIAHWADGTAEDVTGLTRFRTNDESIAEIDADGVVTQIGPGDTHVVAFYDNGVAPTQVLLPVSDSFGPNYPEVPAPTQIDKLVVEKLRTLGVVPSDLASDAEFLRRVSLDMTGTLPTPGEIEHFLADTSADKRSRKIDELLTRPAYAAWWATRLSDITVNNPRDFPEKPVANEQSRQWHAWIEKRIAENMPYDQLIAGIVLATSRRAGQSYEAYADEMSSYFKKEGAPNFADRDTMPHYWTRQTLRNNDERALSFAYSFLGLRLQCAQCHKHPFDQWTQHDFKEFADFFTRLSYGPPQDAREKFKEMQTALKGEGKDKQQAQKDAQRKQSQGELYPWPELYVATVSEIDKGNTRNNKQNAKRPRPKFSPTAKLLAGDEVSLVEEKDPREVLMRWMREQDNPYFAKALVNRVWSAYFGLGIIEPADDLNLANPPSNAPLLAYLERGFIDHGYDLKWLHREIANSRTYQLSWKPNPTNRLDNRNFSHAIPRRLPAEVTYDALSQALAGASEIDSMARDVDGRAIGTAQSLTRNRKNNAYALTVFGRPARATNCDCERSSEPSLLQTIYLRNDQEMLGSIDRSNWLRELSPKTKEQPRGKRINPQQMRQALAKAEQRLEKLKKDGKEEQIDQVTKQMERLRQQVAELKDEPAQGAAPREEWSEEQIQQAVRQAYLRTVSRPPTEDEQHRSREFLAQADQPVHGLRDLMWALLNTKEFIVNH